MADVSALFSMRKGKKKKKKRTNAATLLGQEKIFDEENQGVDNDGPPMKLNSLEDVMEFGEWVEDDDEEAPVRKNKFLFAGKGTKEVLDLEDLNPGDKEAPISQESAEIKSQFHRARQQALAAPAEEPPPEPKPEKPKKFVPRQKREQLAKMSGAAALKNMDSEEYFPSLGGAAKPVKKERVVAASAWGKVDASVEAEDVKKPTGPPPKYLGADFIPSTAFEGSKPGYAFSTREEGLGYYWEGGDEAKKQETEASEDVDTDKVEEKMAQVKVDGEEAQSTKPEAEASAGSTAAAEKEDSTSAGKEESVNEASASATAGGEKESVTSTLKEDTKPSESEEKVVAEDTKTEVKKEEAEDEYAELAKLKKKKKKKKKKTVEEDGA